MTAMPTDIVGVPNLGPVHISALPLEVDLTLYAGDDFFLDIAVQNPDGSAMNLTGSAPQAFVRAHVSDTGAPLGQFTCTVDGTTTGLMHLQLPSSYSTNLPPTCVWDCQLTTPTILTLVAGSITVAPQVTHT